MPVTLDWIDEPHIFQITVQGKLTTDDIIASWEAIDVLYHEAGQPKPFCGMGVIMPDRQIPLGLLKLATHPSNKIVRYLDAAAITGIDHFAFGMLMEMLSRLDGAPTIHVMNSYDEGVTFLRQVVRAQQAGLD